MTHDSGQSPFRQHASGLYVPEAVSRVREVWTPDEWKALERVTKLLDERKIRVYLGCRETAECRNTPLERFRMPDGSISLRCAHKDRVMVKRLKT